ncbi:protein DENND6B-like isoform X2 [Ornithodoros turicata]|uniref:protein DENND6B-like isoform X2 n=1 Tax=Ornithodoros turicata TaxID=34597 RepID=UPI0031391F15
MAEDDQEIAAGLQSCSLSPENSVISPLLPWENFSNWVHCICIVAFDLELGQAMEMTYPHQAKLTEKEKSSICYLAFPDSNSGCMGDTQFQFRIRQCPPSRPLPPGLVAYNGGAPAPLQADPAHFYGYVYFRQVKDPSVRRGYFQKSVVVLTRLPLLGLFSKALSLIAPEYFNCGDPSIEAACQSMDQWPPPVPGQTVVLPLNGVLLKARLPVDRATGSSPPQTSPSQFHLSAIAVPSVHEVDIFRCFLPILPHVQLLWELVIVTEPVVVMAQSPSVCSEMVQALVSMIWPLRYCADYRPFFTIHDSEFKEYTSTNQALPSVILGVTNPFFAKTFQHWPHIIRIGDEYPPNSPQRHKIKKASNLRTLDSKPGLYTQYKPLLQKDKMLLKKLLKGIQTKRPSEVQSALLKRYLLELTQSFMIPLERYMASLMPLQRNISPYKGTPSLGPFKPDDFLNTLENAGPQLTTGIKGDWAALYRKFFRCSNFSGWYNSRYKEACQKLQALHVEAISDADPLCWIQDKQEVEVVDLVLRLKDKLTSGERGNLPLTPHTMDKLRDHVRTIVSKLPEDLQQVLASS